MKPLLYSVLLLVICTNGLGAQDSERANQAKPANAESSGPPSSVSLQEYREILQNERKLLEDQSEKYYGRIDTLINRTLSVLGIIGAIGLGLFIWQFGKTRKEMKDLVHEQFQKQVSVLIESDMNELRNAVQDLRAQIDQLRAFQNQSVIWVLSGVEMEVQAELDALRSTGLQNIQIVAPTTAAELELGEPDLVIFSYDGTEEGRKRLERIVTLLKQQSPPVPLLIYTYKPHGPEVRLRDAEMRILESFRWYLPVNFPTTLVAQSQLLVRTKRKL